MFTGGFQTVFSFDFYLMVKIKEKKITQINLSIFRADFLNYSNGWKKGEVVFYCYILKQTCYIREHDLKNKGGKLKKGK